MKRIFIGLMLLVFAANPTMAQTCETKAVDKNGKALVGAAKTSFITKCKTDTCAAKAIGSDGKKLAGAAKATFMKKCEAES